MRIGGLEKSTLIDFPGKLAAIVFTQGCNFRCGYCYNPELVYPSLFEEQIPEKEVFEFLERRKGKLEGLVITGGEPTMQEDLPEFIRKVKRMGFRVKLDSNGTNAAMLGEIFDDGSLDYIAMDIKGPLTSYGAVACAAVDTEKIQESIRLIMDSGIEYEFRTTVVKSQLPVEAFQKIGELIYGARLYALQKLVLPPSYKIVNKAFLKEKTYTDEEFEELRKMMEEYVKKCVVR